MNSEMNQEFYLGLKDSKCKSHKIKNFFSKFFSFKAYETEGHYRIKEIQEGRNIKEKFDEKTWLPYL